MNELAVKFSIRWKLLTTMICLVVSVLAISTYLQIASQKQIFDRELDLRITLIKEKLISRGGMLSSNLSRQIENGLATVNLSLISEVLKKIVDEDRELTYAILVDSSGRTYIHTLKPELELEILSGHKVPETPELIIYEHSYDGSPIIEFIVPVQISTEPWGVLRLGFSLDALNQETIGFQKDNAFKIQTMIKHSVYVASAFIAITIVIILILSDRLSRPLRRLTGVVNKFAAGDFVAADTIKVNSRDEIGVLAKSFVDMSLELRASYLKLQNYNVTLEQKVKERTIELAEARDEAIKANQSKSNFLSMISHEIRTPMNAIIGMTQMSLKTDLSEMQHDYLSKVKISADSLLMIINDILDTSKIEAGQLAIENIPFNLEDVLTQLNILVGIKAEEKNIELHFAIAQDVPLFLLGDPLRIGQVLLNLVGNAIKFTDTGDIIVKIELVEDGILAAPELILKFTVKDTGIGLQPKQIEELFKPFVQADISTSRIYGGTGLGLTISKQLVELMGGKITVESEFGLGSDFIFTLCLKQSNDITAKKPTVLPISCQGTNVLVVDDNAPAREILKTYLESFEFNVSLACSGEEAIMVLENAHENPYSLVLMDWKMSGMDGIQTAKMIKESKRIVTIPTIIMVTAYAKEDVLPKVRALELAGVIVKPVNPSYLFDTVLSTLQTECVIDGVDKNSITKPAEDKWINRLKDRKILVVDDNSINQQVAQALLEYEGLDVTLADNGQQAVQMVKDMQFDAILMDLQMPVMDGFETTQLIRSENLYSDLPIIALTAYAREKEREKCLSYGMQDCVSKPIDIDQLLLMFSQYIKHEDTEHNHSVAELISPMNREETGVKNIQLSGLDIAAGIKNVAGHEQIYFKLLLDFEQQFTDVLQRIKSGLESDNKVQAKQLAHGLKGVASNIAAFDLASRAADLEVALKEPQKGLTLAIEGFEHALHQVLSDIKTVSVYNQEHVEVVDHNKAPDYDLANKELIKLTELLMLNSLDIDWCFDVIRESLANSEFTEEVKQLGQCISVFDFKTALSHTQVLVQKLPVDQVGHV
ncbi:MAG: response regulator, partial [Methylomarinum sp.]|nr:response regulator [Methylomarinum sp.]